MFSSLEDLQQATAHITDSIAAWNHWLHTAHTNPLAVNLCTRLHLSIPQEGTHGSILMYPVRRLVITNEDTPENFLLLFGPTWKQGTAWFHKRARMEVLLCPPPGSPMHAANEALDVGCGVWRPRGPSEEEEGLLRGVRGWARGVGGGMGV